MLPCLSMAMQFESSSGRKARPSSELKPSGLELDLSGTVLNPTELGMQRLREAAAERISKKRPRTESGLVEQGGAKSIGMRLADVFLNEYAVGSHETDALLRRLVDQAKEDYFRHQSHPDLELATLPEFFEYAVNYIRAHLPDIAGEREQTNPAEEVYLQVQQAFDQALKQARKRLEANRAKKRQDPASS